MSKTNWTIIIVLIVIIAGAWAWYVNSPSSNAPITNQVPPPAAGAETGQPTMSAPTNTSDAAINQDLGAVDSQLNGLNADSANIDASLSTSTQ